MTRHRPRTILTRWSSRLGQGLAVLGAWSTASGVAAASFAAGSVQEGEVITFTAAFALTMAISALVTLASAGRPRLAGDMALLLAVCVVGMAGGISGLLWGGPDAVCHWMQWSPFDLWMARHACVFVLWVVAVPGALMGGVLGGGTGAVAGGLLRLAAVRPRLATAILLTVLLGCGIAAGPLASSLSTLVLRWRAVREQSAVASINADELAVFIGAATGAILGATLTGLAWQVGRRSPPVMTPQLAQADGKSC